jgi:hypothetical protein
MTSMAQRLIHGIYAGTKIKKSFFDRLFTIAEAAFLRIYTIRPSPSCAAGRVKEKRLPLPSPGLSAQMRPPCASTKCLAMAKPMPEPPPEALRAKMRGLTAQLAGKDAHCVGTGSQ